MTRWILHLDMDAFYASVEQLDDPALRGRPVVVGGLGPRGVVATASYPARAYGVHSAQPMAKARRLCPQAVFLAPRFARYEEVSRQISRILLEYTPLVETVSLDEAFLDVTGAGRHPDELAQELHARIPQQVGLSCSVGLGPNKLVAKLASDAAKPGGLRVVPPDEVPIFLDPLPVDRLWGVGPKTARRLVERGVHTVGDLRRVDASLLCSWFGPKLGAGLWRLARGEDDTPVLPAQEAKSLSLEQTYPEDIHDPEAVLAEVGRLAHQLAARLADQGLLARTVRLKVRWSDFTTQTRQISLPEPTDHPALISQEAANLVVRTAGEGRGVRLLGVGVGGLAPATFYPLHLFTREGERRSAIL
ncbi:MAG: DNA polymerase IV [Candidatus Bipolaricaulaceae bacterium]